MSSENISILRAALNAKISQIDLLEGAIDRDACRTFYASTAMLLERLLGDTSQELEQFRRLNGISAVISENPQETSQWHAERYHADLRRARSLLQAISESLAWDAPIHSANDNQGGTMQPAVNGDDIKQAVLEHLYERQQQQPHRMKGYSAREINSHLPQYEASDVMMAVEFLSGER